MSNSLNACSLNSLNNKEGESCNSEPPYNNRQACSPELKSHDIATGILESPGLFSPNYLWSRDIDELSPLFGEGTSVSIEDLDSLASENLNPPDKKEPVCNNNCPYNSNQQACTPELKSHEVATDILESSDVFSPNYFLRRGFDEFSPLSGDGLPASIEDFLDSPVHENLDPTGVKKRKISQEDDKQSSAKRQCYQKSEKKEAKEEVVSAKRISFSEGEFPQVVNHRINASQQALLIAPKVVSQEEKEWRVVNKTFLNPYLTLFAAQTELKDEGIELSRSEILRIWKKYDLGTLPQQRLEKRRVYDSAAALFFITIQLEARQIAQQELQMQNIKASTDIAATKKEIKAPRENSLKKREIFVSSSASNLPTTEFLSDPKHTIDSALPLDQASGDKSPYNQAVSLSPVGNRTDRMQKPLKLWSQLDQNARKLLMENIVFQHPFRGSTIAHRNLMKLCHITEYQLIGDWRARGFETIEKRINALKAYLAQHPETVLTPVQKAALKDENSGEKMAPIIEYKALQNPLLDIMSVRQELLDEEGINIAAYRVEKAWNELGLETPKKRIEALRAYCQSHPDVMLTDIQKAALQVSIKDSEEGAPIVEDNDRRDSLDFMSMSSSSNSSSSASSALNLSESQKDLSSSRLAQSQGSESSIGEDSSCSIQPILKSYFGNKK